VKNTFFTHWFRGFAEGLDKMPEKERAVLLRECGRACSRSYPLAVYKDAYARSSGLVSFLENLKAAFPELSYRINEDQKSVTIIYNRCACDLYTRGLVKTGLLCECSRQSLLYNWEAVMGEGSVEVDMKGSLLRGDEKCEFEVKLPASIH